VKLTTLETRKLRGDLVELFKMFKGFDNLDPLMFFEVNTTPTRGHSQKSVKPKCRKYLFAHRVVDVWNSLDENVITCDSLNIKWFLK